jgi:hypothetical protein
MEKKQTAVEWFVKELFKKIDYIQVDPKLIEQAIAMEKEQIMDAANKLLYHSTGPSDTAAKQYYNETYGGQDESNN